MKSRIRPFTANESHKLNHNTLSAQVEIELGDAGKITIAELAGHLA